MTEQTPAAPDERERWRTAIAVTGNEPALDDWAGRDYQHNRDVSGATDGNIVVSDADPGL